MTLEELNIKFTASMGGLQTQLSHLQRQLGGVSSAAEVASGAMTRLASVAKLFISAAVIHGIYKVGKASLQMANEVVESESLFEVSMKGMAADAREWSEGLSDSLGLNAYALRKNMAVFNTMFRSMGLGKQASYDMATGLTQLAEDMASFYNMDAEEAFNKLRAGITGETEPLKRLGIMVDENTTKQYALAEGISETGKELSQTDKLMARYAAIMAQTGDAQGDLARTINSPVNQIRLLNNTLNKVKITLGQAFQPIQAIVLPILNTLARAALVAANAVNTFLWALTGFTGVSVGAAGVAEDGAEANGELADSLNETAKAMKGAGSAAKKAAKDAKVGLKAFDEVNKLTEDAAKSGGSGGGIGEKPEVVDNEKLAAAMAAVNAAMSKAADWLKKVWELALPTREALSRLCGSLKEFGKISFDGIKGFYENFIQPIGSWALTSGLPAFLGVLTSAVNLVNTAFEAAKPVWEEFYNRVLVPIGNWAGDKIVEALTRLRGVLDSVTEWIRENPESFSMIVDGIISIFASLLLLKIASTIVTGVQTAFTLLQGVIALFTSPAGIIAMVVAGLIWMALNWDKVKEWAVAAWDGIVDAWNSAASWFYNNITVPIVNFFNDAFGSVLRAGQGAWYWIKTAWNDATSWFYSNITLPIVNFFNDAFGSVLRAGQGAWYWIKNAWNGAGTWFDTNVLQPILKFFNDAFGSALRAGQGAWAWIKDTWTGAATWFDVNILQPVSKFFSDTFGTVSGAVQGAWIRAKDAWNNAPTWFDTNVLQPIQKFFSDVFGSALRAAQSAWMWIKNAWTGAGTWFDTNVLQPIQTFFNNTFGSVLRAVQGAWHWITVAWNNAATWFDTNVLQPILTFFNNTFGSVLRAGQSAWYWITQAWIGAAAWFDINILQPVLILFNNTFGSVLRAGQSAWYWIKTAWADAKEWFAGVLAPVQAAIDAIGQAWQTIKSWFSKPMVQKVIIDYSTRGNTQYGGQGGSFGGEVKLPGFASGGVFKPNNPMLAVLGDQTHGRNIEAPESLIRTIFQQEMAAHALTGIPSARASFNPVDTSGMGGNIVQQAVEAVMDRLNINLTVDGEQFGRVAVRTINDTQRRQGQFLLGMG